MRTRALKGQSIKVSSDIDQTKEEKIDAFFSRKMEKMKSILERYPIPAELLKRNSQQNNLH
ncbi:hypothetical protein LZG72_21670 [Dyadobacter sp. CY323]|nr:hypothetical protein [Dyadobacter sp. CY323]